MKLLCKVASVTSVIACMVAQSVGAVSTVYTSMDVPKYLNTSFKSYMDYRCITDSNSEQYKYLKKWAWSDYDGFMRVDGEKDLGITDNYYCIALGSYYGTTIGTKYKITLSSGNYFYGVLSECKDNSDTNSTHQYGIDNNDIIEFLVNTPLLVNDVKTVGSANTYMPLNGTVEYIEKIDFIY